jgi:hypothetical protein
VFPSNHGGFKSCRTRSDVSTPAPKSLSSSGRSIKDRTEHRKVIEAESSGEDADVTCTISPVQYTATRVTASTMIT